MQDYEPAEKEKNTCNGPQCLTARYGKKFVLIILRIFRKSKIILKFDLLARHSYKIGIRTNFIRARSWCASIDSLSTEKIGMGYQF